MSENTEKKKSAGGIWVKTSKSTGDKFLSITVEIKGQRYDFVGFKNDFRTEENRQPFYRIYESDAPAAVPKTDAPKAPAKKVVAAAVQQVEEEFI